MWSQIETLNKIQKYWKNQYTNNLEKTSKLPFYNLCPYKPSKKILRKLKDGVKNIKITRVK